MSRIWNAERMRPVAVAAAVLLVCVSGLLAYGQRRQAPRFRSQQLQAQRGPRQGFAGQRAQQRFNGQYRGQNRQFSGQASGPYRAQQRPESQPRGTLPGYRSQAGRPTYPNATYSVPTAARPAYPGAAGRSIYKGQNPGGRGYGGPNYAPPGHLQSWLNQHRGLPLQDQERLLRTDPTFTRQAPREQQREMRQLHAVDQMPEQQRERRLARNEMLERLNPQQRMNLNQASRSYATLPPDRREMVKRAFQDLRSVPLDQRQTVLNSARYQGQFSPGERTILSNFLDVEPYQSPR